MKYRRVLTAIIWRMLRPCRRNLAAWVVIAVTFVPLVVFVVDHQLTSSPPVLADVDLKVVVIEEHHEGNLSNLVC